MPLPICSIASVMMKEGMPIRVTPKAVTAPSARHPASASGMARPPGRGRLAMFTLASCTVRKASRMPVALATLATLRSISAQSMTKVSPTAMIAVIETCCRIFARLPQVAKDGLRPLNSATSTISVAKGARLRSWARSRNHSGSRAGRAVVTGVDMRSPSSGGQQPVLADRLVREFPGHPAAPHDQDAVGEREHRLRLGGGDEDGDPLRPQPADDPHHVVLGADIHAAGRLAQQQHARQVRQPAG